MSKARNLSDFISEAAIDATEIGPNAVTTDKVADQSVTPAKLHNSLDLSGKTVTLPTDGISGNSIHGGVISAFSSTGIDDNATATAVTITSDGKVGIGISSPTRYLDVQTDEGDGSGRAGISSWGIISNSYGGQDLTKLNWAGGTPGARIQGYTGGAQKFEISANSATYFNGGNVGIGTINPEAKLHVSGEVLAGVADTANSAYYGLLAHRALGSALGGYGMHYESGFENPIIWGYNNGDNGGKIRFATMTSAGDRTLGNGLTDRMVIETGPGNVGIGTTNPGNKLDVKSQINVTNAENTSLQAVKGSRFGYSSGYKCVVLGGTGESTTDNIAIGYDPSGNASGAFTGYGKEIIFKNDVKFMTPNSNDTGFHNNMLVMKDGNIGIGTTTPSVAKGMHIRGGLFIDNQIADPNNVSGDDQTLWVKKEDNKDWIITADGYTGTSTDYGIRLRTTSSAVYGFALQVGGGYTFRVQGNGNVYNSNNSYGSISDIKLKENIVDAASQWDDIKAIRVRKYSFISDNLDAPNQLGVIAQEVEEAGMGGLVSTTSDIDENKNLTGTSTKEVKYSVLYMKAIKALQEAMNKIETLETEMASVKARIELLESN